jgi:GNAT superfamily N-acetyltransferase
LAELVAESERTGFGFVRRLVDEWDSGENRFDKPGEASFVALVETRIVGVGGLNLDPYAGSPGIGRVRRLYVLSAFRRGGVGRGLVEAVISAAQNHFHTLRLRTNHEIAAQFYSGLGFSPSVGVPESTHEMRL